MRTMGEVKDRMRSLKVVSSKTASHDSKAGVRCVMVTLPYELIDNIVSFLTPEDHLPLARTCKYILAAVDETLRLHRHSRDLYRFTSDQEPLTIPMLLGSASGLTNPIIAWHVCCVEIWTHRADWKDWTSFNAEKRSLDRGEVVNYAYSDQEIRHYLDLGREHLHLSEKQIDDARREIRNGGDGFIKALLISLCPCLEDLKFIKQEIPNESQDVPEKITDESSWWRELPDVAPTMHSTTWFKRAIFNIVDRESDDTKKIWPPGLTAVQDVAVGVCPAGTDSFLFDEETADVVSYEVLSCLFSLPNVESIYFGDVLAGETEIGFDLENWDDDDSHWRLPYQTSAVKHLYLHRIFALHNEFGEALIRAPARLQSASYLAGAANNCEDVDGIVMQLCQAHNGQLESLMLHGEGLRGYRCIMYLPVEAELTDSLRQVSINASDIMLDFANDAEDNSDTVKSLVEGFRNNFPKAVEVLSVVGCATDMDCVPRNTLDCLDACFDLMIRQKTLPNLKAIYLEDVERRTIKKHGKPRDQLCFMRTIAAGRRFSVDIHAIATKDDPVHEIDFPLGCDKYDLRSGPFQGARPTDGTLKLNIARGVWEDVGCNDCGTCEDCLECYTADAWKTIRAGGR